LEDIIPCKEENKADPNEDDTLEQVKAAFKILDDLEKSIITIYFQENHPSQDAIARSLGVTQSYLSRRMNSAINKIKSYLGRSKILEPKAFNRTIYDLFREKTKEEVDELLSTLDDLEREIILLFFPLSVYEKGYTLPSIAKAFGFSEFGIYLKYKTIMGKLNAKSSILERMKR
jgi:DNA-directed RNA polymerase specialized sigma subunit